MDNHQYKNRLEKGVITTSNILMYISMGMLLVMMLLGIADVIGRYFLRKPIIGTLEIFEILLPGIVLFTLAYTQHVKGHISVDILFARLPRRLRTAIGIVFNLWAILFFLIVTWRGILLSIMHWNTGRKIPNISVPIYLVDIFIPIGALSICLVLIVDLFHSINEIRKGE